MKDMATIDVRGLSCPAPLIKTKRALGQARSGDVFQIVGDGDIPLGNLKNYLTELGIPFKEMRIDNQEWILSLILPDHGLEKMQSLPAESFCRTDEPSPGNLASYTVVVKSERMGLDDAELGRLLMKSYLNVLPELECKPRSICFYNEGVKMCCQGSPVLESLRKLESEGVKLIVCGTCMEYFNLKEKLAVGQISNMYSIATELSQAAKTVVP